MDAEHGEEMPRDEKIAVWVALGVGVPLILLLLLSTGFFAQLAEESGGTRAAWLPLVPIADQTGESAGLRLQELAADPEPGPRFPRLGFQEVSGTTAGRPGDDGSTETAVLRQLSRSEERERRLQVRVNDLERELGRRAASGSADPGKAAEMELEFLRSDREQLRRERAEFQRQVFELESQLEKTVLNAKTMNEQLVRDGESRDRRQSSLIFQLEEELKAEENAMAQLRRQLQDLRRQMEGSATEEGAMEKLQSESKALKEEQEILRQNLVETTAEKDRLEAQLKAILDNEGAGPMATDPDATMVLLREEISVLQKKLAEREAELKRVGDPKQAMPASRELAEARAEIERLKRALRSQPGGAPGPAKGGTPLPGAEKGLPVEARRPGDLWAEAVPLYQSLQYAAEKGMEVEKRDAALEGERLGTLVTRLWFGKSKSDLDSRGETKLKEALSGLPDRVYLLVVGYASRPGSESLNETLSRRRAEGVTRRMQKILKNGSRVQSVYFGETDQFDREREEMNRVVEIWRIGN